MKLLKDRILAEVFEPEKRTASGLIIGADTESTVRFGVVKYKSDEVSEDIPIGSTIIFGKHIVAKVLLKDVEYRVLCESDVFAVID
jgi:co-chaperonin GroES (HSP10)